jgi:hypothetical protein
VGVSGYPRVRAVKFQGVSALRIYVLLKIRFKGVFRGILATEGSQTTVVLAFTLKVFEPSVCDPMNISVISLFSFLGWIEPFNGIIIYLSSTRALLYTLT